MQNHTEYRKQILTSLENSKNYYKCYLDNGKKFSDAKELKYANQQLLTSLNDYQIFVNDEIVVKAINEISHHLNVWRRLWEEHYSKYQPDMDDVFVFENQHNFQSTAEQLVLEYLAQKIK